MIIEQNYIVASKGQVLRRKSDNWIAGPELWLGYTYYLGEQKLEEPLLELPEHYEEVEMPEYFKENLIE